MGWLCSVVFISSVLGFLLFKPALGMEETTQLGAGVGAGFDAGISASIGVTCSFDGQVTSRRVVEMIKHLAQTFYGSILGRGVICAVLNLHHNSR